MTDLMKHDSSLRTHTRDPLDTGIENAQRRTRCRFGQTRAPKRSIIDHKRGSHRTRRSHNSSDATGKSERVAPNNLHSLVVPTANSGDIAVPHSSNSLRLDSSPPSSPNSDALSPDSQSSALTEHKRPRSGCLQTDTSDPSLSDLSTSAPASCMRTTSPLAVFFNQNSRPDTADRCKQFVCQASLLDEGRLHDLLSKEPHYHPNNAFLYYVNPELEDKVDANLRNEAVHNLRFMHSTFFNLSTETFCKAVNLIDRFIVKVKVKPKYMACVATASYCVASKLCDANKKDVELPAPDELIRIARCGGNAADLMRMEEILDSKLSHDLNGVNAFDFLCLFMDCITEENFPDSPDHVVLRTDTSSDGIDDQHTQTSGDIPIANSGLGATSLSKGPDVVPRSQLVRRLMTRLEIALCSLDVYRFRPACLALAVLAQAGMEDLISLANLCQVDWTDVIHCASLVDELYDTSPCRRRPLVWHLSRRTLFRIGYSSPTPLDTIAEDCEPPEEDEWLLPLLFEP